MEITAEEVVQVLRERFPLQFEIAVQAVQIVKLSQQQADSKPETEAVKFP